MVQYLEGTNRRELLPVLGLETYRYERIGPDGRLDEGFPGRGCDLW